MATTEITRLLEQELARIRAADQRREELLTRLLQEHARQTRLFTERLDGLTQQLKALNELLQPGGNPRRA